MIDWHWSDRRQRNLCRFIEGKSANTRMAETVFASTAITASAKTWKTTTYFTRAKKKAATVIKTFVVYAPSRGQTQVSYFPLALCSPNSIPAP